MCERYLLRKNLMKSMVAYMEMKKQKQLAQLGANLSEDKATFGDTETPGEEFVTNDRLNIRD